MGKFNKEIKIGVFAIVVLVATFVILNILRGVDIFGREIQISGRFDNVEGLVASAPVLIRGYAAGRVNSVEYDTRSDDFVVVCAIDKRFRIPKDSRMMIFSTSIMGGKGIRIDVGTSQEIAGEGDFIATGTDSDLISSLSESIAPVMNKVNGLLDSLTAISGNVNHMLGQQNRMNVQKSLSHLESTLSTAQDIVRTIESDYGEKSEDIKAIIENLECLSAKLAPLADSVGSAVGSTEKTVDTLRNAIVDINKNVDKISQPLNTLLDDIDKLILEVKKNPKKYLKISVF